MTPLTDDQLAELERLAGAASEAPWYATLYDETVSTEPAWYVDCDCVLSVARAYHGRGGPGEEQANAELIAAMRNALPALLAELRARRATAARPMTGADFCGHVYE